MNQQYFSRNPMYDPHSVRNFRCNNPSIHNPSITPVNTKTFLPPIQPPNNSNNILPNNQRYVQINKNKFCRLEKSKPSSSVNIQVPNNQKLTHDRKFFFISQDVRETNKNDDNFKSSISNFKPFKVNIKNEVATHNQMDNVTQDFKNQLYKKQNHMPTAFQPFQITIKNEYAISNQMNNTQNVTQHACTCQNQTQNDLNTLLTDDIQITPMPLVNHVRGFINNTPTDMLVDTGANTSLMSNKLV
jgi:hypothetical protein